ncbi:DUF1415 domain-containing protein [Bradymonas sediminis]|uniref:DUF1415 domain-containing protein n=1 Tax=Bradymonas sediminis TaxID=1548548 RepID=A0A2Z4FHB9_9DELT|nr:DUF1415 domain-containing protein [Bradymonas sediminis]AWV88290.1 DUF1415 domain-containing protein [Bradymonas sediminis]TDP77413.1 hypothetical protein DFR33_101315 [Bradymonas sediminis]
MPSTQSPEHIEERVRRWVEDAVIGLNLCPFARSPYTRDQVRISIVDCEDFEDVLRQTFDEVDVLLSASPEKIVTTLVVVRGVLGDFDDFVDAIHAVDELLEQTGAADYLQLAHFHPDYQFDGTTPEALENFTNRAPFPILHLLREDEMSEVIARHPNPGAIPEQNIARLNALGAEAIAEIWRRFQ